MKMGAMKRVKIVHTKKRRLLDRWSIKGQLKRDARARRMRRREKYGEFQ